MKGPLLHAEAAEEVKTNSLQASIRGTVSEGGNRMGTGGVKTVAGTARPARDETPAGINSAHRPGITATRTLSEVASVSPGNKPHTRIGNLLPVAVCTALTGHPG